MSDTKFKFTRLKGLIEAAAKDAGILDYKHKKNSPEESKKIIEHFIVNNITMIKSSDWIEYEWEDKDEVD